MFINLEKAYDTTWIYGILKDHFDVGQEGKLHTFRRNIYITPSPYRSCHLTPYCGLEVYNLTEALKSAKGLGNTFDLNHIWSRTLPLVILQEIFIGPIPQYRSWNLTPCWGLKVQNPTQALKQVKGGGSTFDLNHIWSRYLPLRILQEIFKGSIPQYRSWHLTPCCGLAV